MGDRFPLAAMLADGLDQMREIAHVAAYHGQAIGIDQAANEFAVGRYVIENRLLASSEQPPCQIAADQAGTSNEDRHRHLPGRGRPSSHARPAWPMSIAGRVGRGPR